jgi:NAD(P)-dependent dehydrogenase (short-subunit alcohol dehydrogenase family)
MIMLRIMLRSLKNKNIVVIGGTSGIGLSAAIAFVENGAHVVVVGKDDSLLVDAKKTFASMAEVITGDATDENVSQMAIDLCIKKFGTLTGLYHIAGGSGRKMGDGPLHEMSVVGWNKTLSLNLTSVMLSNKAAINQFIRQGSGGTILNVGSVLGYSPSPQHFSTHAYAAAKSAIIGFSKSVAAYYAKDNIRVNVVAPGLIETPMSQRAASDETILSFIKKKQPLEGGRIGRPQDLDGIAVYFMSDESRFTTGQLIAIDGGWSVSEGN